MAVHCQTGALAHRLVVTVKRHAFVYIVDEKLFLISHRMYILHPCISSWIFFLFFIYIISSFLSRVNATNNFKCSKVCNFFDESIFHNLLVQYSFDLCRIECFFPLFITFLFILIHVFIYIFLLIYIYTHDKVLMILWKLAYDEIFYLTLNVIEVMLTSNF